VRSIGGAVLAALFTTLILGSGSCGPAGLRRSVGGNPEWALADSPPGDLTVSVTVYAPAGASKGGETPRYLRSMRAIVEPDLSLRASEGESSPRTYPPLTRRLSPEEVRRVWWDLRDSGLLRERHPDEVASAELAAPTADAPPTRGLYIISYVASGHHRTLALDPVLAEDAPGARRLVDRLAALAWMDE
jgi:hypothetical protein